MLGIGWPELLFLLVLLLIFFRPEQLAELARTAGEFAGQFWRMGQRLRDDVEREWRSDLAKPAAKHLPAPPPDGEPPAP